MDTQALETGIETKHASPERDALAQIQDRDRDNRSLNVKPLNLLERGGVVLAPRKDSWWESRAVFNPAAYKDGEGTVHLLYRAIGDDNGAYVSRLGHATSKNGVDFERMSDKPVLAPHKDYPYDQGAIEDPRITEIEGKIYITYVAVGVPALTPGKLCPSALASTKDFMVFERYGIITPLDDIDDRDTVLFPKRIHGDYVMLHRPQQILNGDYRGWKTGEPSAIWMAFSKDLKKWGMGRPIMKPEKNWEAKKIGAGPPPIETPDGWLLLYHGVDKDHVYRAGAALLDLKNPTRVIARLSQPILEPKEKYEAAGDVPNVVFPEGAVVLDERLYVYYGGGDKVCAVATVPLANLLDALRAEKIA
jgi:predicted GH43/DUF377 family glycosyl hydrolase